MEIRSDRSVVGLGEVCDQNCRKPGNGVDNFESARSCLSDLIQQEFGMQMISSCNLFRRNRVLVSDPLCRDPLSTLPVRQGAMS